MLAITVAFTYNNLMKRNSEFGASIYLCVEIASAISKNGTTAKRNFSRLHLRQNPERRQTRNWRGRNFPGAVCERVISALSANANAHCLFFPRKGDIVHQSECVNFVVLGLIKTKRNTRARWARFWIVRLSEIATHQSRVSENKLRTKRKRHTRWMDAVKCAHFNKWANDSAPLWVMTLVSQESVLIAFNFSPRTWQ